MTISFLSLVFILGAGYVAWRLVEYGSGVFMRRRLEMFDDFPSITSFEESALFGFFKLKVDFPPGRLPRLVKKVESVDVSTDESINPDPSPDYKATSDLKLPDEQITQRIPRWPKSMFRMPRYVQLEVLGKEARYELVPVIVHASGFFRFATIENEEEASSFDGDLKKQKKAKTRHPLHFWEYVSEKDTIGFISGRRYAIERYSDRCLSPRSGHIVGFQVLNGTQVEKGDIVMILAVRVGEIYR